MSKTYRCAVEVRGYELDSYGHVNHSVYLNYLEHARWKLLHEEGITLQKLGEWKRWPVIAAVELKYLKPTFMGDTLEVRTTAIEHSRTHFLVEHNVLRGDQVVLIGTIKIVIVNEQGRPAEMPEAFHVMWEDSAEGSAD